MRKTILLLCIITMALFSCSQERGLSPGYRWELFKSTTNWELAKAVAKEDTASITQFLQTGKFNINLQEPQFGRTLLMLAVGNDKEKSVRALLEHGADVHLSDNDGDQALHEAVQNISLRKHTYAIIEMLLQHGSDVNAVSSRGVNKVPMQGAVEDSACARLLFEQGANLYYRNEDSAYLVWSALCSNLFDNTIVARYLIVEKKMPVPHPILYAYPDREPRGIFELLGLFSCQNAMDCDAKKEIIEYLKKEGFPKKGVYK